MKPFNNEQPEKDRNNDPSILKAFLPFENVTDQELMYETCGNIKCHFEKSDFINGKFTHKTKYGAKHEGCFYESVSAPMMLARLIAAGFTPFVADCYKTTFSFILRHKTTGLVLTFYDYKGAASYGSNMEGLKDKIFLADTLKVLKALMNPRFPHPYDDCVIGEIA